MTEEERSFCALEQRVAVLTQKSEDDDKALILAKDALFAKWLSAIAVLISLLALWKK